MQPMNLPKSVIFTLIPALLLYAATHLFIPFFTQVVQTSSIIGWYTGGLFIVFLPMFIASLILYRKEKVKNPGMSVTERFRLQRPDLKVILCSLAGVLVTFALTYLFMQAGILLIPGFSAQPSFMHLSPLKEGEMWILAAWIPMFIFNILGEAFYWRGYMFPRQELSFGKSTWIVHGFLWLLFHFSFGINLMLTLLPIIFITSWLVQKTKSTWTDIIIHTSVNGTGFILVAFGVVS
jgi:membrane protease YdiL (CAAX protease family)